jgi:hypothetical protein
MTSVLGSKIAWWIDPMGATILAVLIICLWGYTAKRNLLRHTTHSRGITIVNWNFSRPQIPSTSHLYRINT